jgi:predicted DNA binding CopG/RHH family protein
MGIKMGKKFCGITLSEEVLKVSKDFAYKHGLNFSEFIELLLREKFGISPVKIKVQNQSLV